MEVAVQNQEQQLMADHFATFEAQANEWMDKAKTIQVTDIAQTEEMQQAREARLALRGVRLAIAEKHKMLKEDALRYGQTLDKIKRTLTGLIEPIEEHLEKQEKFAEAQEAKRKKELFAKRADRLKQYMPENDINMLPLAEMSEEAFNNMFDGAAMAAENKKKQEELAAKKAQEEAEEKKRLEAENKKLNAKLEKEREEKERIEAEAEAMRQKEEQRKRDEANAKRRAARAPDKEKLEALKNKLYALAGEFKMSTEEGEAVMADVRTLIGKIVAHINKKAENL